MDVPAFLSSLERALEARRPLFDAAHRSAFRLYNGFYEGSPRLAVDLYASTLVFHNYADDPASGLTLVHKAQDYLSKQLSWLGAGILKSRSARTQEERRGRLLFGQAPDRRIQEHEVWYAVDLTMSRDASLYLDTRSLRRWLSENMQGRSVLNTFANTGSLGVAAAAGGATRVVQLDLSRQFLNLAKESYSLNGFPVHKGDFVTEDFFPAVSRFKRRGETFDCVLIDPPFFSATSRGRVDQQHESARLINKVRPLVEDGGILVAVNNALYMSGRDYMQTLESLCKDGYLKIRELILVPQDFTGYRQIREPITDPAPFNHSTKIAVLEVRRKQGTSLKDSPALRGAAS